MGHAPLRTTLYHNIPYSYHTIIPVVAAAINKTGSCCYHLTAHYVRRA
ncbi:hypothetical protein WUBG_11520 [Wuchereria bancrofti]|uniref:Uncharacterized protein n=1 Tax=Wuchereria bancrofti TaxID=6293 RepID=J9E630_WUCBA|nr:hypothetical protein WUBG_11520 [Wuchereria bancrofti]